MVFYEILTFFMLLSHVICLPTTNTRINASRARDVNRPPNDTLEDQGKKMVEMALVKLAKKHLKSSIQNCKRLFHQCFQDTDCGCSKSLWCKKAFGEKYRCVYNNNRY